MSTPKLDFFKSPQSPALNSLPVRRVRCSVFKEPPVGDLRWMKVEQWLDAKSLASNTKRAYIKELKRFWNWTDKPWNQITTWDVTRYKKHLETVTIENPDTGTLKRQYSSNSVALAVRSLKSFFSWMNQACYLTDNPTLAVSAPNEAEPESKELTESQIALLYGALEQRGQLKHRDTALLAILSHGLRAEEASKLNIEDYDGQRLHIRQAKQGSTGKVPLDKPAQTAIKAYLEWRRNQGEQLLPDTPFFINYSRNSTIQGKRLSYNGIYSIVKQLGRLAIKWSAAQVHEHTERNELEALDWEIATLENVHPHQLRHTFASNLVLEGMDAYLAMALTRHRSISVFKRYSSKVREKQAERAFRQMRGELIDHENE